MSDQAQTPDLFEETRVFFERLAEDLRAYHIEISPELELRRASAMLSYYNFNDGHIYIGIPDPNKPLGRLMWVFARQIFLCETDEELSRFLRLIVRRLLAHELAHHLRHRYGKFGEDLWYEEQVANQFAVAVTNRMTSPQEKSWALWVIQRTLAGMPDQSGGEIAAVSYHNILHSLNIDGKVPDGVLANLELIQKAFDLSPEELVRSSAMHGDDAASYLDQRGKAIDQINQEYATDVMRYMQYHLGWASYDLTSSQSYYIEEWARTHLGSGDEWLPVPEDGDTPTLEAIESCYQASRGCQPQSETASRYFYKRYRGLLLHRLQVEGLEQNTSASALDGWIASILENWDQGKSDLLDYLAQLAPPELARLFPNVIRETLGSAAPQDKHLPTITDQRLWQHVAYRADDPAAANTLARLHILDQTKIFEALPISVLMLIAGKLSEIRLADKETLVWQDDHNTDIFIVVSGELSVLLEFAGRSKRVNILKAGEVLGDMAFFTGEARSATVRARTDCLCFVLKASDLGALAHQHPVILMKMGQALARRLALANSLQKTMS